MDPSKNSLSQSDAPYQDAPRTPSGEDTCPHLEALVLGDSPPPSEFSLGRQHEPTEEELLLLAQQVEELGSTPCEPLPDASADIVLTSQSEAATKEDHALADVKTQLSAEELSRCDDAMIRRFIRATGSNLPLVRGGCIFRRRRTLSMTLWNSCPHHRVTCIWEGAACTDVPSARMLRAAAGQELPAPALAITTFSQRLFVVPIPLVQR